MLNRLFGTTVRRVASCLFVTLLSMSAVRAAAPTWKPITEAERAPDLSGIDASSGVVVLLREISADESDGDLTLLDYYIRLKILDARGVEAIDKIEIPFTRGRSIRNLAARVVKADGTVLEVGADSFYTREVVRAGRLTVSVKAFAFPGLEPGCIAEYRYRVRSSTALEGLRMDLDDEFPVALVRLRIRPFSFPGFVTQAIWSDGSNVKGLGRDKRGYHLFEARNIAPVPDEPMMPPHDVAHPWFAYYFTYGSPQDHWGYEGGELAAIVRELLKPNKALTKAAESITAGATTSDEKIARLYEYCRTKIKNLSFSRCGYTPEQIEDLKPNESAVDVLTNGYGTRIEINLLFAALMRTLGADCYLAYCNDRGACLFDKNVTMKSTLPDLLVALRVGDWKFYDPGSLYVPMGKLRWQNEATVALVADSKYYEFIETPDSDSDYSSTQRIARLRLDEEGTLEGDVELLFHGHDATDIKETYDTKTEAQALELVQAEVTARMPTAEISQCAVTDIFDPEKPVSIRYHIRVPGYAETTGDRVFLQPAFFQKGQAPRFPAPTRVSHAYFPYYSSEEDRVTIDVPKGCQRDVVSIPQSMDTSVQIIYHPRVVFDEDTGRVTYTRKYSHEIRRAQSKDYALLKSWFDLLDTEDAYSMTLRRAGPAAP
jgi:hypothetical protein